MKSAMKPSPREMKFAEALIFLLFFIVFLIWCAMVAKIPTGMAVLICGVVAGAYGMFVLHISWDDFFNAIQGVFMRGIGAILILLFVGIIIGSWLVSGTTPMIIYYGLKLISPSAFLVLAFLICSVTSMATGSGWSIMGSFGVALMGVAIGLGISPVVAGAAIASGSYIGDKWSPFSDVPNLNSALVGGTSFDIFKAEIPSTVPGIIVACIVYFVIGMQYSHGPMDTSLIMPILEGLDANYNFNLFLMLPAIFVIVGGVLKWPVLPTLFGGALLGGICGMAFQGASFPEVCQIMYSGFTSTTGIESLDKLLSGGGLNSMLSLILTIMCAFMFAGIIERMGLLNTILGRVTRAVKNPGPLVLASTVTTVLGTYLTSSVYVTCIMNAQVWREAYDKAGLDGVHLATVLTEAGSPSGLIVPWSGGALLMMSLYGLEWYQYTPYLIYYWVSLVLLVTFAFMKKFIVWKKVDVVAVEAEDAVANV
ncbi:Na+/H+ antiporter NhaC family protein [Anaerotignum sp.]|uniref:Na+/H+ antiporter NhaC family protein n=1 Tax=Anaerotignum sp. TaxID=2039241 RepID=UPI0028AB33FC|nr:Na+/H+ antiporter NhaC family protein [Anaerotignum sp.]